VQDPSREAVGPAQHARGQGQIAVGQGLADQGTAHPQAVQLDGGGGFQGEAVVAGSQVQVGEVAGAVAAETEVVTDLQVLHPQAFHQHLLDEGLGGQLAQSPIEVQAEHVVDAQACEAFQLLAQAGQTYRRDIGQEEFPRLRLEDHHATRHPELRRPLTQPREDGLVPQVNPVEVANGGNAALGKGVEMMETTKQLHG